MMTNYDRKKYIIYEFAFCRVKNAYTSIISNGNAVVFKVKELFVIQINTTNESAISLFINKVHLKFNNYSEANGLKY